MSGQSEHPAEATAVAAESRMNSSMDEMLAQTGSGTEAKNNEGGSTECNTTAGVMEPAQHRSPSPDIQGPFPCPLTPRMQMRLDIKGPFSCPLDFFRTLANPALACTRAGDKHPLVCSPCARGQDMLG
jgi:hypothetical protein